MKLKYNVFIAALTVSAVNAADINVFGTRDPAFPLPAQASYLANNYMKPSFVSLDGGIDGGLGTNIYVVHDDANLDGDGNAKTVTWTSNNVYFVRDKLFIPRGTTLTIQPGTTIYGSINDNNSPGSRIDDAVGAITACRDGNLIANGTAAQPIVFTSDRVWEMANTLVSPISPDANIGPAPTAATAGLWGGVVLLGKAYVSNVDAAGNNTPTLPIEGFVPSASSSQDGDGIPDATQYGSSTNFSRDDADNSGIVRYVSIQHGGYEFSSAREINGLTLGAVGSGTTIEFVEVYANQDDGIEFFGGTVNTKNMIMAFNQDDSFDIDESYNGTNQFWFAIQNPGSTDAGGEWDGVGGNSAGYNLGGALANQSNPKIYNATLIGPGRTNTLSQLPITTGTVNWEKGNHGMLIEDRFAGEIYNSVFDDFAGDLIRFNDTATSVGVNYKFQNNTVGRFGSVPVPQLETATLTMGNGTTPAAAGGSLPITVTVNSASPGGDIVTSATIAAADTIDVVAGKIATAVLAVTGITGNYTAQTAVLAPVSPLTAVRYVITLVETAAGTQDTNLNINIGALAGAGISAAATSSNTQTASATSVTAPVTLAAHNLSYLTNTFVAQANTPPLNPATPANGVYNAAGDPVDGNSAGDTDPLLTAYTRDGSSVLQTINPAPLANSPLLNASIKVGAPQFVAYRGAFGPGANTNWAAGWTKLSASGALLGAAPLPVPPTITDTDGDGISDTLEGTLALTNLGFSAGANNVTPTNLFTGLYTTSAFNTNFTAGQTSVTSNPGGFGLYTLLSIQNLSADDIVVQKSGNTATLNIPVESSANLVPPFTAVGNAVLVIPNVPVDKEFYRFRVAP